MERPSNSKSLNKDELQEEFKKLATDPDYKDEFQKILFSIIDIERNYTEACSGLGKQFQNQGIEIDPEQMFEILRGW